MPCGNPLHNHDWPITGEFMIYHCERQCGYCMKSNFNQTSHLRAHVKENHEKNMPGLEVLEGRLGNAGKYPTERHKPRKPKAEHRANQAAKASVDSQSPKEPVPEQLPLPDAHAYLGDRPTAPSQSRAYFNNAATDFTGMYPTTIASDVIDHASPAPTCFSDYHSATMSPHPSLASHSAYEQAPAPGPSQQQRRHPYCGTFSTGMDPTPSATGGFCPPGYRPAQPYRPLAMRPHTSETPVVQENQPVQAQLNLGEAQVMLSQTLPSETTASFQFGPYDDFIHQSILSEHPVQVEQPVQVEHAEHPNPTQSQEIYDDSSPATTEALEAVDSKVDELLDLIAAHQSTGADGDSLRARVRQRLRNLGRMTQVGADFSSIG